MAKTKNFLSELKKKYRVVFTDRLFLASLVSAVSIFVLSLFANFYAAVFALDRAGNSVTDLILSNIPVFDVDMVFIYGPIVLWVVVAVLCFTEPKRMPFTINSIALFILIRSVFITLTHIGPFPTHLNIDYSLNIVKLFTSGGDLFFSAHTGLPFLMALVFGKRNLFWRVFFTVAAILFGVIVLLAHIHYSIDVLSAFFITYTIYILAEKLFRRELKYFEY